MANEAVMLTELEPACSAIVSNTTAITKGSLCKLTDPNTAALSAAAGEMLCGIAATDKIANDGKTSLGFYKRGEFKMYASGAIPCGMAVSSAADANYPNYVKIAAVTCSGASVLGIAEETVANGETLKILVNVGCGGNQIS